MIKCIWLSIFAIVSTTAVMAMDPRCGELSGGLEGIDYSKNHIKGAGWFYVRPDENAIRKWEEERWKVGSPGPPDILIDCRSCEELKQEAVRVNSKLYFPGDVHSVCRGMDKSCLLEETRKWREKQLQAINKRRQELKCD
jgi:hypothetical protein